MDANDGQPNKAENVSLVKDFGGEFGSAAVGPNVVVVDQKRRVAIGHFYLNMWIRCKAKRTEKTSL